MAWILLGFDVLEFAGYITEAYRELSGCVLTRARGDSLMEDFLTALRASSLDQCAH
jgi:hypothetical protein